MSPVQGSAIVAAALSGLYMIALGVVSIVVPARATRFLLSFAATQSLHFVEILLRAIVGVAFILAAPRMSFSGAFTFFGWILLVTTACLAIVPWRWHRRFAQTTVPYATRYIALLGLASMMIGGIILAALLGDSTA